MGRQNCVFREERCAVRREIGERREVVEVGIQDVMNDRRCC